MARDVPWARAASFHRRYRRRTAIWLDMARHTLEDMMQGPNDDSELGSHGWRQDVVLRERVSVGRQRPGEGEARPYGYRRPRAVGEEGPYVRIEDIIVRMTTQHEMLEERDHRIAELEE